MNSTASFSILLAILFVTVFPCVVRAESASDTISSTKLADEKTPRKASPQAVERWRDWRYGMFIHWGPVSLTEKEISWARANTNPQCPNNGPIPAAEYDALYKKFNPTEFDAKEWVAIAKAAGMKYIVLTVKHCDGFLLWDSKVSDYNIMRSPFRRDVAAELAKACHEAGMGLGWYFSPMDWKDPDCRTAKNAEFVKRIQTELTELLTNYGKVDILWFDTDARDAMWDQENTYQLIRRLQPDIMIDERLDLGCTGWNQGIIGSWADFHTPEQFVGAFDTRPWESCMTVSAHNQWSWGGHGDGVKPAAQCLDMLIRCAGANGNMMLNVGPMATGEIAPEQTDRIKEIGEWLARYGESVYGTRGGPFKPSRFGVSTHKGDTVYLHLLDWKGGVLRLPELPAKILSASVITGGEVAVVQTDGILTVTVPASDRLQHNTVVALRLDRPASEIAPMSPVVPSHSLFLGKPATASSVHHYGADYAAGKAFDDDEDTRWAADDGIKSAWLAVDLGELRTVGRAVFFQAYPELKRIRKFAIEYREGDAWKTCFTGENPGATTEATFAPVTAREFRLNITESTDGPTISEFQIFEK